MIHRISIGATIMAIAFYSVSSAYTGRVVTRDMSPVANAKVTSLLSKTSTTTLADGTFSIGASGILLKNGLSNSPGFKVMTVGAATIIRLESPGLPIKAALYAIDGREIAKTDINPGLAEAGFPECRGLSFIRLTGAQGQRVVKLAPFSSARIKVEPPERAAASASAMKKNAAGAIDTLLISKSGFVGKFRAVLSTETILGDITVAKVDSGMILVPAGDSTFQMGSATGATNEQPVHAVSFSHDFFMDTVEVTQGSYKTLLAKSPWTLATYSDMKYDTAENKSAIYLTWYDAVIYCNARSKRDGLDTVYRYLAIGDSAPGAHCKLTGVVIDYSKRGYRLPTEAEWEYACRAGTKTTYYWGNDTVGMRNNAVCRYNSKDLTIASSLYGVNPVGTKLPNAFNLHDMAGNVYEMCNDYFGSTYYSESPAIDPPGPATGASCIYRGGSWKLSESFLASSTRASIDVSMNTFTSDLGFRCVITADK